jgi:hypothetical protein
MNENDDGIDPEHLAELEGIDAELLAAAERGEIGADDVDAAVAGLFE